MAGVKGRSGGPRKNAGGKRPGAGRKPKLKQQVKRAPQRKASPELSDAEETAIGSRLPMTPAAARASAESEAEIRTRRRDAKAFLEGVLSGDFVATDSQIRAAQALLPFQHKKLGETGKKEQRDDQAKEVAGRFRPSAPPRLATVAGKKVT